MRRYTFTGILCIGIALHFLYPGPVAAQTPQDSSIDLHQKIDHILDTPALSTCFEGVLIQTVKDQNILYSRNADRVFLPASNNKLLTGSAALALLGPDFKYKTDVVATGTIQPDGSLAGDLILKGSGNPLLTYEDLKALADQVQHSGVHIIHGSVSYNDGAFDNMRLGEGWNSDDEMYAYSAQISALNVNENVIQVTVHPGAKPGDSVVITTNPDCGAFITLDSTAITTLPGSRTHVSIERLRGSNTLHIDGAIAVDTAESQLPGVTLTVDNPAGLAATLFNRLLQQENIRIDNDRVTSVNKVPENAKVVASHISLPLAQLLIKMNKPSDNLMAECLLKTVGAFKNGTGSSGYGGTGPKAAREWFASIGMNLDQLHQVDGSGLSRQDYVSPRNLVTLLRFWAGSPQFQTLYDSLPIAGVDGTLRNRMKGTAAAGNCHAKTGSLAHVSCLSGYVTAKDGALIVFSLLFNNQLGPMSACLSAENQIVTLLADSAYAPLKATDSTKPTSKRQEKASGEHSL